MQSIFGDFKYFLRVNLKIYNEFYGWYSSRLNNWSSKDGELIEMFLSSGPPQKKETNKTNDPP